jgi:hypothetical protein
MKKIFGANKTLNKQEGVLWCLMPLSTIFQLYRACSGLFFFLVDENGVLGEKITDLSQVTDKILSHK